MLVEEDKSTSPLVPDDITGYYIEMSSVHLPSTQPA